MTKYRKEAGCRWKRIGENEWNYSEITLADTPGFIVEKLYTIDHHGGHKKSVICINTGDHFQSVKEAAEYAGCTANSMSKHLNCVKGYETIKGMRYVKND